MNLKIYKRTGLFSSTLIVIGSLVGIGIFIKNGSIFNLNNGNSVGILIAWILGAIIALLKGYSFLEISSINSNSGKQKGMTLWMQKFVGKNTKTLTNVFLSVLYLGVLLPIITGYSLNFFMMFLGMDINKTALYVSMFTIPLFFLIIRTISINTTKIINNIITIIKVIPLLLVAFLGLFHIKNGGGIGHTMFTSITQENKNFTIAILISLPSVLFSFDAFLNVVNTTRTKENDETISKSILLGMLIVSVLYIMITISQININRGSVATLYGSAYDKYGNVTFEKLSTITGNVAYQGLVDNMLGEKWNKACVFFIAVSGYGISNIIVDAGSNITSNFFKENSKMHKYSGFIFLLIVYVIISLMIIAEEITIKNRASFVNMGYMSGDIFDSMSNIPVIFAFGFYVAILCGGLRNRITNKVKVKQYKGFVITSIISIALTITVLGVFVGYTIIYQSIGRFKTHETLIVSTVSYSVIAIILFVGSYIYDKRKNKINKK